MHVLTTSERIDRGHDLLAAYVANRPEAPGSYGPAITEAIRDLLALADNHAWRSNVLLTLLRDEGRENILNYLPAE